MLGLDVVDSEEGAFWTAFLRSLRARGLSGVQLVIRDHHLGLKSAIRAVFVGACWQRCRVHFMRNALARVPKASAEMVAAAIRTVFAQPGSTHVRRQLEEVRAVLAPQFQEVAAMLVEAAEDLLAFTGFPVAHWRQIWSTNPYRLAGHRPSRLSTVEIADRVIVLEAGRIVEDGAPDLLLAQGSGHYAAL